jgi:YggT family protein
MRAILDVILLALDIYTFLLIAMAIASWLVAFSVINTRNEFVRMIWDFLYRITEPALRPIRQRVPLIGGIDISPIVLFLLLYFVKLLIVYYIRPYVF